MFLTTDITNFHCTSFLTGGGRGGRGNWGGRGGRGSWSDCGKNGRGRSGQGLKGFSANDGGGMDFKKRMSFNNGSRFGKHKYEVSLFVIFHI